MNKVLEKIDIHNLGNNLLRSLWVIIHLTTKEKDRFTQSEISNYLVEDCKIETSRQAIDNAFKSKDAKGLINKNKKGFKIMQLGIDFLLNSTKSKEVYFFESGNEFKTKRIELKSLFIKEPSEIYLCDPYIDVSTLDVVHEIFPKSSSIKILTQKITSKLKGNFERQVEALIRDGYDIEVRKYDKNEIHDRYIITDKEMFLSGNSLNFLGKKDSFIIRLGADMRTTVLEVFNRRWKVANEI
ncbi:hypothetical protein A3I18_00190 [Candidatus Campbellbacteria bacterium RIFCSPLOWO2_02_FULL_35_11]|uniref:PLD phosphodiesterase domain-containing protein n=2 Tax=Candidatus Campbelliibacteriota TaxID=1752727 RepID=A0A1F5ENN3_9BACT|nr:MAG: hypothetical protein A3E89_01145 [Candidatus Campbellbacteria bacterium RIFCSPHIGHO2_12_FULL_35_10]OGD70057.1 MAG: hypothetical protein A3I18_00190 [Candidatus Campbellbacteria bacterium RIFCSPLOWO2_02_FULL_35_11]